MAALCYPGTKIPTFPLLVDQMVEAVRTYRATEAARVYPSFDRFIYGAIVFQFCPRTEAAREYVGGFNGNPEIGLAMPITPDGSMILPADYWDDGDAACDCHGHAMALIQGAYHAVKNGHGQRSNHCPADALIKGRSNQTGAVVFDIMSSFGSHDEVFQEEWLRVYSVVLGGEAFMNVACAEAVKPILQNFAASMRNGNEFQYYVITP